MCGPYGPAVTPADAHDPWERPLLHDGPDVLPVAQTQVVQDETHRNRSGVRGAVVARQHPHQLRQHLFNLRAANVTYSTPGRWLDSALRRATCTDEGVQLLETTDVSDQRHGCSLHVPLPVFQHLPDLLETIFPLDDTEGEGFAQLPGPQRESHIHRPQQNRTTETLPTRLTGPFPAVMFCRAPRAASCVR